MKFLTIIMLFKASVFVSILQSLTGCSTKGDAYTMYTELPTYQPNDASLSCTQLDRELDLIYTAIDDMNNSIVQLENSEKSIGVMSSFSYMLGAETSIPMAPSLLNQDVIKMKHVRHSFQKRSNVLIQQFYAKGCASQEEPSMIPKVIPKPTIQTIREII